MALVLEGTILLVVFRAAATEIFPRDDGGRAIEQSSRGVTGRSGAESKPIPSVLTSQTAIV
ncbi:MAG: hypothetical protein ABIR36_01695 [Nitrospiraceae bacterium]